MLYAHYFFLGGRTGGLPLSFTRLIAGLLSKVEVFRENYIVREIEN